MFVDQIGIIAISAYAAKLTSLDCYVVCPENTVQAKKEAAAEYGAAITECEATEKARELGANDIIERTGAVFVHPFAHEDIICGQGTAGLEILQQISDVDAVLVPVGGGGLLRFLSSFLSFHQ